MKPIRIPLAVLAAGVLLASPPASGRGPEVYALTEVRIVAAPGEVIPKGTIVLRDGVIEAVGADLAPPADARVLERPEMTAYAGLIDPYVEVAWPAQPDEGASDGAHPNAQVRPERSMAIHGIPEAEAAKLREAGITTAAVAPREGIFRGTSAVLNLGHGGTDQNLLRPRHAQNVTFARNARGAGYPSSLMGSVALFRQTLLDALWQEQAWAAYSANPSQQRPALNHAYSELADVARGAALIVLEGDSPLDVLRNGALAQEFDLEAQLVASGAEYRWIDEVSALELPLIVPVDFPPLPEAEAGDDLVLSLEDLRSWDLAPSNLRSLLDAGTTVAATAHRLEEPSHLAKQLFLAIDRGGLEPDEALAAVTITPARLLGIERLAGTLEPGKMANLVLVEGELFAEKPNIREVWVDGHRFEIEASEPATIDPAGTWELLVTTGDGQNLSATMVLEGEVGGLSGTISDPSGGMIRITSATVSGSRLDVTFEGASYGTPGEIEFSLEIEGRRGKGSGSSSGGTFEIKATRAAGPTEDRS